MLRKSVFLSATLGALLFTVGCESSDNESSNSPAGNAGSGGSAGSAGAGGSSAGSSGTGGSSGVAGSSGVGGNSGAAGSGGTSGASGASGTGGTGGTGTGVNAWVRFGNFSGATFTKVCGRSSDSGPFFDIALPQELSQGVFIATVPAYVQVDTGVTQFAIYDGYNRALSCSTLTDAQALSVLPVALTENTHFSVVAGFSSGDSSARIYTDHELDSSYAQLRAINVGTVGAVDLGTYTNLNADPPMAGAWLPYFANLPSNGDTTTLGLAGITDGYILSLLSLGSNQTLELRRTNTGSPIGTFTQSFSDGIDTGENHTVFIFRAQQGVPTKARMLACDDLAPPTNGLSACLEFSDIGPNVAPGSIDGLPAAPSMTRFAFLAPDLPATTDWCIKPKLTPGWEAGDEQKLVDSVTYPEIVHSFKLSDGEYTVKMIEDTDAGVVDCSKAGIEYELPSLLLAGHPSTQALIGLLGAPAGDPQQAVFRGFNNIDAATDGQIRMRLVNASVNVPSFKVAGYAAGNGYGLLGVFANVPSKTIDNNLPDGYGAPGWPDNTPLAIDWTGDGALDIISSELSFTPSRVYGVYVSGGGLNVGDPLFYTIVCDETDESNNDGFAGVPMSCLSSGMSFTPWP